MVLQRKDWNDHSNKDRPNKRGDKKQHDGFCERDRCLKLAVKVAFVVTQGFKDVLLIGNQDRPRLFDLAIKKPQPLFSTVVEVDERLDADGKSSSRRTATR